MNVAVCGGWRFSSASAPARYQNPNHLTPLGPLAISSHTLSLAIAIATLPALPAPLSSTSPRSSPSPRTSSHLSLLFSSFFSLFSSRSLFHFFFFFFSFFFLFRVGGIRFRALLVWGTGFGSRFGSGSRRRGARRERSIEVTGCGERR